MSRYKVCITGEETSYTVYNFEIEAKSLSEAKAKAKRLAEDDEGDFAEKYCDYCDPNDAYETFTVQNVEQIK